MADGRAKQLSDQLTTHHDQVMRALVGVEGAIRHLARDARTRDLTDAAQVYGKDAERERSTMWRLRLGMLALLAIATGFLAFAANNAIPAIRSDSADLRRFLILGSLSLPALLGAAYLSRQASAHRKAASEIQRQRNQLLTLDPYLDPLPEHARLLYRALFARRFFPRSTDELDAMEDEEFPLPSMILTAVDPETFESPG